MPTHYKAPLEGKVAIVTGGGRGIGAAISQNLASKGANVVLNYTSDSSRERTQILAERLAAEFGIQTTIVQASVGELDAAKKIVDAALELAAKIPDHGKVIDIIINNAGVARNDPLGKITVEEFNRQYKVNVLGPLLLVQEALPYLPTDRSGRIVNLSSVSATQGFLEQTVYGGTKAALDAMTRTWARELSERATVNSVNPGPVKTDMYGGTTVEFRERMRSWVEHAPLMHVKGKEWESKTEEEKQRLKADGGREGYPEEIAGVVGMLCTPDAAWTTGSVVSANGGMVMSL
ncbi:short chain dehydrogenase [Ascobolus immersus RN42]|uniref:Short chain dehydrogenase n=1 Tax=Ascobolus immersus RN42 TaxID=1160509 RepID=A0A3N4IDR9_ASCIM|nr:short chain dehydrogenase [Ascobolus immersus RN42]